MAKKLTIKLKGAGKGKQADRTGGGEPQRAPARAPDPAAEEQLPDYDEDDGLSYGSGEEQNDGAAPMDEDEAGEADDQGGEARDNERSDGEHARKPSKKRKRAQVAAAVLELLTPAEGLSKKHKVTASKAQELTGAPKKSSKRKYKGMLPRSLLAELSKSVQEARRQGGKKLQSRAGLRTLAAAVAAATAAARAAPRTPSPGAVRTGDEEVPAGRGGAQTPTNRQLLAALETSTQMARENSELRQKLREKLEQLRAAREGRASLESALERAQEEVATLKGQLASVEDVMQQIAGEGLVMGAGDASEDSQEGDGESTSEPGEYGDLRQLLNAKRAVSSAQTQPKKPDTKQLQSIAAKPQQFDGKAGRNGVRNWLAGLKEYIDLVAEQYSEADKVKLASTFLEDNALRVWQTERENLPAGLRGWWAVFEQVMLDRYDTGTDAITARYQLDVLQQGTRPVAAFVQTFDTLISYVPGMGDEEKVHRFLAAANEEVQAKLQLNPNTNSRWTRYVDLRQYALKLFAYETAMRAAAAAAAAGGGRRGGRHHHPRDVPKGLALDAGGGDNRPRKVPKGAQQGPEQPRRRQDVKDFCFAKGMCYRCYSTQHTAKQCKGQYANRDPPGFAEWVGSDKPGPSRAAGTRK
jgi:hypothetical protein